jgi:hypothetical protein
MLVYTQSLDEISGRLDRLDQELRDLCIENMWLWAKSYELLDRISRKRQLGLARP